MNFKEREWRKPCEFCESDRCDGCELPYSDEMTFENMLSKVKKVEKFYFEIYWRKVPSEKSIED